MGMKTISESKMLKQVSTHVVQVPPSSLESEHPLMEMARSFDQGFIVAWLFHDLVFGTITDGEIQVRSRSGLMDSKTLDHYLERARLFNQDKECYLFRGQNQVIQGRIREDGDEINSPNVTKTTVKDVQAILLGRRQASLEDPWVRVGSGRGADFVVPAQWVGTHSKRTVVHMRYYLGYVHHLATIVDQRIVQMTPANDGEAHAVDQGAEGSLGSGSTKEI